MPIPKPSTEYGGYEIHNCPVCSREVTIDSIPLTSGMLYQVSCTSAYPECCCRGPIRTNSGDAVEGWHNLIGRYSDGSTKHL